MDQKQMQVLLILVFCLELTSGERGVIHPKEGQQVDIHCKTEPGLMIVWFRVLDKSGMEFIASFSSNGVRKGFRTDFSRLFTETKMGSQQKLTLKSFNKERDSGIYSCASLFKGNEMKFGNVTRLIREDEVKVATEAPPARVTEAKVIVTTKPCVCNNNNEGPGDSSMTCDPLILGSLASGCGLLLLLLIVTILYCNRIRTRRCPHHYKRKPRVAPEKQMLANRNV